jgi:hypothetical protein
MGKKKSKTRGAPSSSASVAAPLISQEDIMSACRVGNLVMLRRWGRQGVRVTNVEPLLLAIENGDAGLLRCLVMDLGADVKHARGNVATPLHFAAQKGNLDLMRYLITELGADVNQANSYGSTSLSIAAENGLLDVVRCLVTEYGVDVNGTSNGVTPLHIATWKGFLDLTRCLVREFGADVHCRSERPLGCRRVPG